MTKHLTTEKVLGILKDYKPGITTRQEIAAKYETGLDAVKDILAGNTWTDTTKGRLIPNTGRPHIPFEYRFQTSIRKEENGCWTWTSCVNTYGYGETAYKGKQYLAHRLSYEFCKGPIPEGLFVCHSCDNPACINPDHLWVGTHTDNMRDKLRKGRGNMPFGSNHWGVKLTEDLVRKIRSLHSSGTRIKEIMELTNLGRSVISSVVTRRSWRHVL